LLRSRSSARQFANVCSRLWAWLCDPKGTALVHRVRAENLTYLSPRALLDLRAAVRKSDRRAIAGAIVECGCALGGSAIVLTLSRRDTERPVYVYDVFGVIPPPSDKDGDDVLARYATITSGNAKGLGGDTYYGYRSDLLAEVRDQFAAFGCPVRNSNVHLVAGLFEDTVRPTGPIAVGHIDGDWYESVRVCLERLWPFVVRGGVLIIDDYDHWSGCRVAVDEFIATHPECVPKRRARLRLLKY
jgi:asparagine synthase (glutamine-hydrolysing)